MALEESERDRIIELWSANYQRSIIGDTAKVRWVEKDVRGNE